jgi:acyl carrier protein
MNEAFYVELAEIIDVPRENAGPDFRLADGNWDSVAVMSTIALIDEQFGTPVSGEQLRQCVTMSDVLLLAQPV